MATRGFSLIVVLAALAIMSLLLIAIFSGNTRGIRFARNDAALARATMLADSAAALVIGQIQEATTPPGQAWISQPGLIRTFAAANSARTPAACYKLYSAAQEIDTSGGVSFLAADVPTDWNSTAKASVYTDLNAPEQTLAGAALYPILDAQAPGRVPGLSTDAGHAVEMPVAWLYQLQDGSLGPASAATAANPIMGRVAFWTDDETSKIDVNTAGTASTWNTPCTTSSDDTTWATTQPAVGEFERYPGHPAGVSLDGLFGALSGDQLLALTPRYDAGGSEFGTQTTTAASSIPLKMNRLYGSVDELLFGAGLNAAGERLANPITPAQIELTRFVLTAHSHAPETTLLGEPRVAIWPVSDAPGDSTRTTAADRAVESDATLGTAPSAATDYFFQRQDATSATTDLDPSASPASLSNSALFQSLVTAGGEQLPGNSGTFAQKYPGTQWPQLMVEILDAIRGFNAIDPAAGSVSAPTSFVPFAAGDGTGVGRGLIVPLTTTTSTTSGTTTVRGLGRYPTLFGITLVLYVSGYGFSDGSASIDYETAPDADGSNWRTNFPIQKPPGSRWSAVNKALVRAFIVPTTFQPNCGFPEVSDGCSIQITGLDQLSATVKGVTTSFGFDKICTSRLLSDAATVAPADRGWGGFEGPLAWRAAALDAMAGSGSYAFAGRKAVPVPDGTLMDSQTKGPSASYSWSQVVTTTAVKGLTVQILDSAGNTVQTLQVNLPSLAAVPLVNGEADHADGSTPATSKADWASNPACAVAPSYYMTLRNRLLATQRSRALMIQAGDASLSVEPATDPRLIAALPSVPATFFHQATSVRTTASVSSPAATFGYHYHNLRFADGTSACFVGTQKPKLTGNALQTKTASFSVTDWDTGGTLTYTFDTSAAVSAPLSSAVTMTSPDGSVSGPAGDWDTGPGLEPDGALANFPDAGTTLDPATAYQSLGSGQMGAATRRSPNALIPSPVVFGSLPAGVNPASPAQSQPWRTLLFCPYPSSDQTHPGRASLPDYLVLDRFWMPVVEPYGISTRFETAGKINLNDQIAPFTYLHRNTALHALLHGLRLPAIASADAGISATTGGSYKIMPASATFQPWRTVDENATIAQIEGRFATGDAYLTEGEVCSVPLIPDNLGTWTPEAYWTSASGPGFLTGDNLRELPYAQIYSRLTTRSNSFTVHIRAQALQKINDHSDPAVWREGIDRVVGEWRGSYEIERYLDANAPAPKAGVPLGPYKFRIVSAQRFTP